MKKLFFGLTLTLLAAFCAGAAAAQPSALEIASRADNTCLVQHVYANAGAPSADVLVQQAAVAQCISLEQGTGAWYTRQHATRGSAVSAQQAQAFLQKNKALSGLWLKQAMARCALSSLGEVDCLAAMDKRSR